MFRHDDLESLGVLLAKAPEHIEQAADGFKISIRFCLLDRSSGCGIDGLGRKIDLGRLVDEQELLQRDPVARNWGIRAKRLAAALVDHQVGSGLR